MTRFNQTTTCTTCNKHMTIEISTWDNLGTLEEEMSAKDYHDQERFTADHRGHEIAQVNN